MAAMTEEEVERRFLAMYERDADTLFRFCLWKLRDRDAAVELVQETYTRVWEYARRGNDIENFRAFAFRIARNAIADYVKKSRPLYEHELREDSLDLPVPGGIEEAAEFTGVLECLRILPEDDQELVMLRYVEGMPVKDIAEDLGERPNTVTQRLRRAIASLRSCLGLSSADPAQSP